MTCPFPGMDPFIEQDDWQDFHLMLTAEIKRQLAPQLPDHYRVSAELVVKQEQQDEFDDPKNYRPDIGIIDSEQRSAAVQNQGDTAVLTPPTRESPPPVTKQRELLIRDSRDRRLVTAIEVLSPTNKRPLGGGKHMDKLRSYWQSNVNTIDIDLLRGGFNPYPENIISVREDGSFPSPYRILYIEPNVKNWVWEIGLTEKLPTIPIPLSRPDKPVVLDLQLAFEELYTYSTYPARKAEKLDTLRPELEENEVNALKGFLAV